MKTLFLVLTALLFSSCATPPSNHSGSELDLEMSSLVSEVLTQPREHIGMTRTFYRIARGSIVIDICASDLATALEKRYAKNPAIADDADLAAKLRVAIRDSVGLVLEEELHRSVSDRALYVLEDVFRAGGYRVVEGAEDGSSLVVGEYSFGRRVAGSTFAGGGVVFFWSKSRKQIFSVNYWIT